MSKLWAITCLFNPAGFSRREINYRLFRKNLQVPLATIELSFNGQFVLEDGDADLLIRLNAGDIMWQKERLLNLLIDALPDSCEYVAWLDCDVLFDNRDWPNQTMEALEKLAIVQLFEERLDLPPEAIEKDLSRQINELVPILRRPSVGYLVAQGGPVREDFLRTSGNAATTCGLGWAATRKLLKKHHLYDACIIGGGDRLNLASAMGWFDLAIEFHRISGPRKDHYLSWARKVYESAEARVGYIPGRLFHLWHGNLKNRQYVNRFNILTENGFNPHTDIELDSQGIWKWASEKPEMHRAMIEYFASRKEDGNRQIICPEVGLQLVYQIDTALSLLRVLSNFTYPGISKISV